MPENRMKAAVAEAIGTFALVFVGLLAISAGSLAGGGESSLLEVALAHGLTIAVMVAAVGAISGGHFNPAVTLGFLLTGRTDGATAALYWIAQLGGALAAAAFVAGLFGSDPVAAGTPAVTAGIGTGAAIALEAVTTFFLVFVIFGTAVDDRAPRGVFPLAIGLTITLDILAIGPLTGGAMNPARAFGPALAAGAWTGHAIYWIGPLLGGALGGLTYHHMLMERVSTPVVEATT